MCGIFGLIGRSGAAQAVVQGLRALEYRGYDSAGLAVLSPEGIAIRRAVGPVDALAALDLPPGTIAIGHTRWATHGRPTERNAHPHCDCTGRIAVVHNGIIENHAALREKLEANGHVFASDTDTEVIAHLVEERGSKDLLAAVRATLDVLHGSYALAIVSADAPDRIIAARRRSPLLVGLREEGPIVASDSLALLPFTHRMVVLEDHDVAELHADGLRLYDAAGNEKPIVPHELRPPARDAGKGEFAHHTLKEIHEIPQALRDLLRGRVGTLGDRFDITGTLTEADLRAAKRIVIIGCGTSYYAGILAKTIVERLAHIPVEVHLASEYRYAPSLDVAESLGIYISQSGETADTLEALRIVKARGGRALAFVNVPESTLAREADATFDLRAGPEVGVASTKAFVNMLGGFYLLGIHLARVHGHIDQEEAESLAAKLRGLPSVAARTLLRSDALREAGEALFADSEDAFFLGRHHSHGLALEGALKLKEIGYVHAEGYAAGELKHGPLALLVDGVPVTALVPAGDPTYDAMLSTILEVKARGARVLGLVGEGDERATRIVDRAVGLPRTEPLFFPVPASVALYLLAYHTANARGCAIDRPRNLAKSVTVE